MRLARTTLLLLTLSVAAFLLRSGGVPTLPAERAHPGTAATDLVSGTADLPPGMTAKDWALVRARGDGKPLTDEPDQFAKILHDMRVPSDRTESEYRAGYRVRELQRAAMTRSAGVPLPWVERGPGNVAGRTRGVIVDPDDPSGATWIIGTVGGGVWRTTNEGATWTNLTPDLPNLATSAIAMADVARRSSTSTP